MTEKLPKCFPFQSTSRMVIDAARFSEQAHDGQVRKYTGVPYATHCAEVATWVKAVGGTFEMQAAALLHDVVEDTAWTNKNIEERFGATVARLVAEVTDVSRPEDGNRAARKELDFQHLKSASNEGLTIKAADMLSNIRSITLHDPEFAGQYLKEKERVYPLLIKGKVHYHLLDALNHAMLYAASQLQLDSLTGLYDLRKLLPPKEGTLWRSRNRRDVRPKVARARL